MQVLNSLRNAKQRHPDCQIVKRKGRLYVICKTNPRFKAVQGRKKKALKKQQFRESSAYQGGCALFYYRLASARASVKIS